jgi:hypothetical protein
MNIKNAIRRLLNTEDEVSYSQRLAIVDLIESMKCCGNCKSLEDKLCMNELVHPRDMRKNICGYWQPID